MNRLTFLPAIIHPDFISSVSEVMEIETELVQPIAEKFNFYLTAFGNVILDPSASARLIESRTTPFLRMSVRWWVPGEPRRWVPTFQAVRGHPPPRWQYPPELGPITSAMAARPGTRDLIFTPHHGTTDTTHQKLGPTAEH